MAVTIYLALGSNLGQRAVNLRTALAALTRQMAIRRVSPVYETEPWGYSDQPAFYNLVIEAETEQSPQDLLAAMQATETHLGRQPSFRYGPRLIDIDVLLYGSEVLHGANLDIPHPRMAERAFVLAPLADLAPDLQHPLLHQSIRALFAALNGSGGTLRRVLTNLPAFGVRTYVMGVLNLTPDSFSGDGLLQDDQIPSEQSVSVALAQARQFAAAGVDIVDVGGESTRPGSQPVSTQEELARVVPVIRALAAELNLLISVDTSKAEVAEAALNAGAHWVNDVWGLRADPRMAAVVAQAHAPVILMHNRLKPNSTELQARLGGRYVGVHYDDLLGDIRQELLASVALAEAAGIPAEHIILDPGVGFGKTVDQNLTLINRLDEICALGYPVLLGPSRKSFIGYTLNLPADQRVEGTAAAVAVGIARGADMIRVHDVDVMARVARMTDAIVRR